MSHKTDPPKTTSHSINPTVPYSNMTLNSDFIMHYKFLYIKTVIVNYILEGKVEYILPDSTLGQLELFTWIVVSVYV